MICNITIEQLEKLQRKAKAYDDLLDKGIWHSDTHIFCWTCRGVERALEGKQSVGASDLGEQVRDRLAELSGAVAAMQERAVVAEERAVAAEERLAELNSRNLGFSDLELAADYVARCVPIGFSSPESNERCCAAIDTIAADILAMRPIKDQQPPVGLRARLRGRLRRLMSLRRSGLAALVLRQQQTIEGLDLELLKARSDLMRRKSREGLEMLNELKNMTRRLKERSEGESSDTMNEGEE